MEATSCRISCSASAQATASSIRTVPATMPACGMTLGAEPARTIPQTTETPARGSRRRLRIAGSSVMSLPSAKVRSSVRCGREVCPPLPTTRTVSESAAPVSGPSRSPIRPTSRLGSQCRPKTWSTSRSAPAASRCSAPPGMTSSAGWKSRRTRPGSRPRADTSARASPAPTRPAVCTSWPQAWATPGTVLFHGSETRSSIGSASRSARSATSLSPLPISAITPPPSSRWTDQPEPSSAETTRSDVRASPQLSSGWAWRSRRSAIRSSAYFSMTSVMTVVTGGSGIRCPA